MLIRRIVVVAALVHVAGCTARPLDPTDTGASSGASEGPSGATQDPDTSTAPPVPTSDGPEVTSDPPSNPLGYLEFNYLVKHARGVITDSGGITEETAVLGVPCLTLRDNTERPETVTIGTNELIGTDPIKLPPALKRLMAGQWKKGSIPPKWDGKTAERIVEHLEGLLTGA